MDVKLTTRLYQLICLCLHFLSHTRCTNHGIIQRHTTKKSWIQWVLQDISVYILTDMTVTGYRVKQTRGGYKIMRN